MNNRTELLKNNKFVLVRSTLIKYEINNAMNGICSEVE